MAQMSMGAVPWWHARHRPDAIAVIHGTESLTWSQLARNATRKARALKSFGIGQNDRVTIALPNGNAFFEAVFSVWMVGGTPNPIFPRLPPRELQSILELADPKAIIAEDGAPYGRWPVLPANWCTQEHEDAPLAESAADRWKIMASGGSTGHPKLIVDCMPAVTDPTVNAMFEFESHRGRLGRPNGVMLNPGPLYHNGPFAFTFGNMLAGSKIVGMVRFDAEETLRLIERHQVELLYLVPTMMQRISKLSVAARNSYDLSSLKAAIHVGAPCPQWLKEDWIDWLGAQRVWESYGATEAIAFTLIDGTEWLKRRGSVGRFHRGGICKVLDVHGNELPTGQIGELWCSVRAGQQPQYEYIGATRRSRDGFDSVGDLGRLDEDGFLYIVDRRSDLILRGGVNIYPAEIEAAIDAHPDVASSAVIGLPDADLGARVHAIVELRAERRGQVESDNLLEFLKERLAAYKLPASIEFVEVPLRDAAGKIRRMTLRDERTETESNT